MENSFYPEIDVGQLLPLRIALGAMLNDPLWLERAECPYGAEERDELRTLLAQFRAKPGKVEAAPMMGAGGDKWGDLGHELNALFSELRNYAGNIEAEDVREKMAYFRTATALLDKITGLSERAYNVRAVSDFQARVIAAFDEILSPEQRTQAMEKLGQ